jgi:uncharacterized ubiquitin-like protein YukD
MPPTLETISVILATTMGTDQWDLNLPIDVPAQALINKLVGTEGLPFRGQDDDGQQIPYRLMWKEGGRYLAEAETLRTVGVQEGNTLVMAHEARAGEGSPRVR